MRAYSLAPTSAESASVAAAAKPQRHRETQADAAVEGTLTRDFGGIAIHALAPPTLQAKLAVNAPGDRHEQEADRVADQVMHGFAPAPQRAGGAPAGEEHVVAEAPASVPHALQSGGRPMDGALRAFYEPRFGRDFGQVRLHAGARADEAAAAIGARAFTVGRDIVFGAGQYAPDSVAGRHLLAHELTHVAQQEGSAGRGAATPMVQRALTFKDCKTKVKGKEDAGREKTIEAAVKGAKVLVKDSLDRLKGGVLSDSEVFNAFQANFGEATDDRIKAVIKVYEQIKGSLDGKDFACTTACKSDEKGDVCARAKAGNTIEICPEFFKSPCADVQPLVILHEAVHNAGMMGNQDKPPPKSRSKVKLYPPKDGEKNAYSYQHFSEDLQNGTFAVKSPSLGSGPKEVEVTPSKK